MMDKDTVLKRISSSRSRLSSAPNETSSSYALHSRSNVIPIQEPSWQSPMVGNKAEINNIEKVGCSSITLYELYTVPMRALTRI